MEINDDITARLENISKGSDSPEKKYDEMLKFLHREINKKDIEYSVEIRVMFDLKDLYLRFYDAFFDNGYYNPLVVCVAAMQDKESYNWLAKAYHLTHNEEFNDIVLRKEIERLISLGWNTVMDDYYNISNVTWAESNESNLFASEEEIDKMFDNINDILEGNKKDDGKYPDIDKSNLIYQSKTFKTNSGITYIINHTYSTLIEDDTVKVDFVIEYHEYKMFTAFLKNDEQYQEANQFISSVRDDILFTQVENQLKDEISLWIEFGSDNDY